MKLEEFIDLTDLFPFTGQTTGLLTYQLIWTIPRPYLLCLLLKRTDYLYTD